jgi:hypothetical protein
MFTDISIGKILNPIGPALSYQAAADAWSNWGITGPVGQSRFPARLEHVGMLPGPHLLATEPPEFSLED